MSQGPSSQPPFPETVALNTERLKLPPAWHPHNGSVRGMALASASLTNSDESISYVPGEPTVDLVSSEVHEFLARELGTPLLDEVYPRLWLAARKSSNNIDPLHRQAVKGWDIVPTENPKLHLVWRHNKIYVKPIPVCLLNYQFWDLYMRLPPVRPSHASKPSVTEESSMSTWDRPVAIGFLRSYAHLIQHPLDFVVAREHHLIPNNLDWIKWSKFIANFRRIEDHRVAKRYHYGQLRLSRLHWVVRIFRPRNASTKWFYELPYWSTASYVEWAIAPFFFVFASVSLVLSAMQVVNAVPPDGLGFSILDGSGLQAIRRACWVFSIIILLFSGMIWMLLLAIPFSVLIWQVSWGFKHRGKAISV